LNNRGNRLGTSFYAVLSFIRILNQIQFSKKRQSVLFNTIIPWGKQHHVSVF
jgi:hypothetical protein